MPSPRISCLHRLGSLPWLLLFFFFLVVVVVAVVVVVDVLMCCLFCCFVVFFVVLFLFCRAVSNTLLLSCGRINLPSAGLPRQLPQNRFHHTNHLSADAGERNRFFNPFRGYLPRPFRESLPRTRVAKLIGRASTEPVQYCLLASGN